MTFPRTPRRAAAALFAVAVTTLASVLAQPALAAPLKILGVEEPPGSYANDKGKAFGLSVDVVAEIQRRVGNKDPIRIVPETDALESARTQPNVVAFSFSRTAEREPQFHWITQVIRKPWVVYALKTTSLKVNSLAGMREIHGIGVVDGDVRAKLLQKDGFTNLLVAAEPEENIQNLLDGKVQAIFYEPAGVAYYCRKLKCGKDAIVNAYSPRSSDVYILMSKGTPAATVKAWQDAAAAMKADGTFEQIAKRWVIKSAMEFGVQSAVANGAVTFK